MVIYIGQVSSADAVAGIVRVAFPDRDNLVSGELPVLMGGGWGKGISIPSPGETVLCVFLDSGRNVGFCLGTYGDPPGTSEQRGVWFEDGSYAYYDRSLKQLAVKAAGGIRIDGNVTINGSLTATGTISGGGVG